MTLIEYFTGQGLKVENSLKAAMAQANRNASGKTSESIQFEVTANRETVTLQVVADKNILALQDGRGKSEKGSKPGKLKDIIKEWIRVRGITPEERNGKIPTEKSLIFLITRKIHREGYKGTPGLIDDIINDSLIDLIQREVAEIVGNEFVNEIRV